MKCLVQQWSGSAIARRKCFGLESLLIPSPRGISSRLDLTIVRLVIRLNYFRVLGLHFLIHISDLTGLYSVKCFSLVNSLSLS